MRVLLIEDDPVIARELLLRWQSQPWVVRHATSLEEADAALVEGVFDIVLLDLGLPDGDGLPWLEELRRRESGLPVLILTARDRVVDRVKGLQLGADDYLVKPFAPEELDARIEVMWRRARHARERLTRFGRLSVLTEDHAAFVDGKPLELTPREFEVLCLLATRAPRLVPKGALVEALAQSNLELNDSAAELYVSRLRRKLEASGVEIRTVRGVGYQLGLAREAGAKR
jgi:DNA-binding response OmpR family regulator